MKNNNYSILASQDSNGNKFLAIVKGKLNKELVNDIIKVNDPKFEPVANQLRNIIDHSNFIDSNKGGEN
ncbi:MAG: hypothetical protein LKE20_04150 [Limosilactobacillus oris]|jgi:hypothetical protein|uniref:hypothetical protein n=1 Tax=Limosilactobacillus oris TaxID=1632 RepID=UPI00242EAE09|nr:hypothetical protein [Limosilactobacillus oris]MCH3911301.1 hypothetical protein [Limosilactobacillus oris]MCH3938551.1 hypothetical protein [Limosilactobacillus oris]MCI1980298.1 hypothetical protein [Limosilactobacillus oris]MCI2042655.1 hypothetical protein [Limosilactobacillus oris]